MRTPVWGIVTEPIAKGAQIQGEWKEYVPSSHVKYLEQTGAKVVAVSYTMQKDDLYDLLDQLSGVYFAGDSVEAPSSRQYASLFANVLSYAFEHNHDKFDYFPVVMVGSTL